MADPGDCHLAMFQFWKDRPPVFPVTWRQPRLQHQFLEKRARVEMLCRREFLERTRNSPARRVTSGIRSVHRKEFYATFTQKQPVKVARCPRHGDRTQALRATCCLTVEFYCVFSTGFGSWSQFCDCMTPLSPPPLRDIGFYLKTDGVAATAEAIRYLLEQLPAKNLWCVEFGAWDGFVGSNSRPLIVEQNYSAVLIEGNRQRFADLKKNYASNPRIIPRNQFVGFNAADGLDSILAETPAPLDFDFLTIDIDGNDYHVWNAIVKYRPKVVMIEFNPTIPPEVSFIQPADPQVSLGNSLAALVGLGKKKNYELVAVLGVNAFFVTAELFPLFGIADNRIESLWTQRDCVTYFFVGYDGRVFLRGCQKLPWQEHTPFNETQVQILPGFLQKYPWTKSHYRWYQALHNPTALIKKVFRRLAG